MDIENASGRGFTLHISEDISLALPAPGDAEELFVLVDSNRLFLREWLPWLDSTQNVDDSLAFIHSLEQQYREGLGFMGAVVVGAEIVGMCGFHPFNGKNASADIGYWLAQSARGKGVITRCVQRVIAYGFETMPLNKVTLSIAENNVASRAVAERCGFVFEGVERHAECLYGTFVDHAKYSLLRSECCLA